MNENVSEKVDASVNAWNGVGEAVNKASDRFVQELGAYLDWTSNLQKDILEYYWFGVRQFTRASGEQFAFLQRVATAVPTWGQVPKGTETISGMVNRVVNETKKE